MPQIDLWAEPSVHCLKTRVRNLTGVSQYFSYLGAHGMRLAPGEEAEMDGNLLNAVAAKPRARKSLYHDLQDGLLTIVSTPSPIYYDLSGDTTKVFIIDSGVISARDPCYGHYVSSFEGEPP